MTPTPERALELACCFETESVLLARLGHAAQAKKEADIAAILRHYAEILPKWQAVLDAEPSLVEYETFPVRGDDSWFDGQTAIGHSAPDGAEIVLRYIIKPAP